MYGVIPSLIIWIYAINEAFVALKNINILKRKNNKIIVYIKIFTRTFIKLMTIVYIGLTCLNSIVYVSEYIKEVQVYTELEHLKYIKMSKGQLNLIKNVQNYITSNEENDIYILDSDAALYMIPLNRYNKDFDMFLKGNLGGKGEEGQIEKINNMESNTKILIKKDNYKKNWQNPNEVTEYIKNNLQKIDEIEYFDVYEK